MLNDKIYIANNTKVMQESIFNSHQQYQEIMIKNNDRKDAKVHFEF